MTSEFIVRISRINWRIEKTGFNLGLQKCQFAAPSIKYLGHVVDRVGIHVDKDKVKAMSEMMPPTNVKMVWSFLGACGYYWKFIKDCSKVAAPLTELTKILPGCIWLSLFKIKTHRALPL